MKHGRAFLLYGLLLLILTTITAAPAAGEEAASTPAPAATTPAPEDVPPPLRSDTLLHDTSLLDTESDCLPPCWHDITPGETGWNDALSILARDPALEILSIQGTEGSFAMAAEFQEKGGTLCCQLFTQDRRKVSVIFMRIAPDMTLAELIEAQGQPDYVIGSIYNQDQAVMNLLYEDRALVVYAFVAGANASLSASSEIVGVLYLTRADMDLLIATTSLYTWKGYQSFSTYSDVQYDVTPVMTLTPTPP
jgi:hypothetical protein